ncbi:LOW QUALITY PROTEIN: zf-CCHC domain-containing protein, partial [Cephalotus follicularis]
IEDAVSTLIYNIANYFVGDPTYLKDRTTDQLSNLRCRKLQDFRWYKDTFMTKVLTREDANQPYWKEKFITGLPTLFAEKIKNKYREKHKGFVPYEKLTYGDIVSTITKTLEICYDIKMSKQIKKDSKTYKKELGYFCTQFGYETFKPPPSKNLQKQKLDRKNHYKRFEKSEYYRKPNRRKTHFKTNNFQKSNNDFPNRDSKTCYNCGKPGHIARYCKIQKQIKKLDLTEDHRNQLFRIIDNQSLEEGESDYFSTSSTKIQAIKNSSSESEFSSDNSNIKTCNCNNRIIETLKSLIINILYRVMSPRTFSGSETNNNSNRDKKLDERIKQMQNWKTPKTKLRKISIKEIDKKIQKIDKTTKITKNKQNIQLLNKKIKQDKKLEIPNQKVYNNCYYFEPIEPEIQEEAKSVNLIERITYQKWNINIIITIQDSFKFQTIVLVDSGTQINCIQEELIPTKFFEKTEQKLSTANGENLRVKFKISDVHICNGGIYIKQLFISVKDNLDIGIILGQPFLEIIKPFKVTNEGITT